MTGPPLKGQERCEGTRGGDARWGQRKVDGKDEVVKSAWWGWEAIGGGQEEEVFGGSRLWGMRTEQGLATQAGSGQE
jgi:hypothetical protein